LNQKDDDVEVEELPPHIQRRVFALKNIRSQYIDLEKKFYEEAHALTLKYDKLYAPLLTKSATIVGGEYEPTDEESKDNSPDAEAHPVEAKGGKDAGAEKGVPNFWLTVMQNNMRVAETIVPEDEPALAFLKDVRVVLSEKRDDFTLEFHFAENPYFTDSVLTKTYLFVPAEDHTNDLVFERSTGCKINWKPNKNLTVKIVKKPKAGGGRGGRGKKQNQRTVTTEEPCESFFNFFNPPEPEDEMEPEEADALNEMLENDLDLGSIFRENLVPHAVLWFTGEALDDIDMEDFEYGDEEDDEGEDDEEDEDEEEEDDEEEKEPRHQKRRGPDRGGRGPKPSAGGRGNVGNAAPPPQPECKQQ